MKARGATLAVNCTGIRAEESAARKKKAPFKLLNALCLKERKLKSGKVIPGREVYEYMPIHHLTTRHVFWIIEHAGQQPHHAYSRNKRLSCVICIMGCEGDILNGAEQRPDLVQEIAEIEQSTGYTMFNGQSLNDRIKRAKLAVAA